MPLLPPLPLLPQLSLLLLPCRAWQAARTFFHKRAQSISLRLAKYIAKVACKPCAHDLPYLCNVCWQRLAQRAIAENPITPRARHYAKTKTMNTGQMGRQMTWAREIGRARLLYKGPCKPNQTNDNNFLRPGEQCGTIGKHASKPYSIA